jgi:peptidoglycan-associated lipoprotein
MRIAFSLPLLAAVLLAACSSQPPAPEQAGAKVEDRAGTAVGGEVKKVEAGGNIDGSDLGELKNPKSILSKREVFFDYDSYVIKPEFQNLIQAHAKFLVGKPKMKMLIQGNADERGSREYNLALGQKRAEALKKALLLLGVREEQVESVSLGEEKPRCTEQTEECWAQNRRDDMLYSGEY